MRKLSLLSILLIVGLVVVSSSAVVLADPGDAGEEASSSGHSQEAESSDDTQVLFGVDQYIQLSVDESATDLGNVAGDAGEETFDDVNSLDVDSNYSDGFIVTTEVTGNNYDGDHLEVKLADGSWNDQFVSDQSSEDGVDISYKLVDIDELGSGNYNATVTFTASTK